MQETLAGRGSFQFKSVVAGNSWLRLGQLPWSEEELDCPWVTDARYSTKQGTAILADISTHDDDLSGTFKVELHPEVLQRVAASNSPEGRLGWER